MFSVCLFTMERGPFVCLFIYSREGEGDGGSPFRGNGLKLGRAKKKMRSPRNCTTAATVVVQTPIAFYILVWFGLPSVPIDGDLSQGDARLLHDQHDRWSRASLLPNSSMCRSSQTGSAL